MRRSFEQLVKTEKTASAFFKRKCWENYRRYCVRCHSFQFYRTAQDKMRCKRCGYTFHDFTGRWINKSRITCRQWLLLIKYFEAEFSAKQICEKLSISYPTALRALELLRLAIIANSPDSSNWLDYVYFRAEEWISRQKSQNLLGVFGVIECHGKAKVDLLKGFPLAKLLSIEPKILRNSGIYYTDKYYPYDTLIFHDFKAARLRGKRREPKRPYKINEKSEFWKYTKSIIIKHHGISLEKFPQYLKEIEFRYNHRGQPLFDLICRYLVSFIPAHNE